nr:RNA-directed DNA polymerase, eukaryota [Tanacetum cinerariifolium]
MYAIHALSRWFSVSGVPETCLTVIHRSCSPFCFVVSGLVNFGLFKIRLVSIGTSASIPILDGWNKTSGKWKSSAPMVMTCPLGSSKLFSIEELVNGVITFRIAFIAWQMQARYAPWGFCERNRKSGFQIHESCCPALEEAESYMVYSQSYALIEEMLRLQALGSNTSSGVPYTKEEIYALARKGKQRGHLPGVGRVLPRRATDVRIPPSPSPQCTHNSGDVEKLKKKNKYLTKQVNLMMKLFRSDDKFSQMLNQFESKPEFGNASGSGGCEDDEMAGDEDGGEDEEDEKDGDSPTKSPGKVVRESIPGELSLSIYPGRHVSRDWYPQRQVSREGVDLSLGKVGYGTVVDVYIPNRKSKVGKRFAFVRFIKLDFVSRERIVWIDKEGVPLHAWSRPTFTKIGSRWGEVIELEDNKEDCFARKCICIKTKHEDNILEKFKIIVRGKVFVLRAKELFIWSPMFIVNKDIEYCSEDDSVKGAEENNVDASKQVNMDDDG